MKDRNYESEPYKSAKAEAGKARRRKLLWSVLFLVIAAFSILAVASQTKQGSLAELGQKLSRMNPWWAAAAVGSMFCFILTEGFSIRAACSALGFRPRFLRCCQYAAADIYFSAITPSATGGQPASVLLMYQDGISIAKGTAALLINLTMCAFATFGIGIVCFLFHYPIYRNFSFLSRMLIGIGFLMQLVTALFLYLMVWHETLLHRICAALIRFGARVHLIRNKEDKLDILADKMAEYHRAVGMIADRKHYLFHNLAFNFLQRVAQLCVTMFVFLAMGLQSATGFEIWAMQGYVVMGSNYVPIPGGMGIADLLLLDGFGSVMEPFVAAQLELISRSLSFYLCILLCGGMLLLRVLVRKLRSAGKK